MQKEFIGLLKEKASILEVISRRVKLKRSGRDWFGLCPFHSEKTPSFKVDAESGNYYCFGCGTHGDVFSFIMESEKLDFNGAVEFLANMYGIRAPERKTAVDANATVYAALGAIKSWFSLQLNEKCGSEARRYLELRKISSESIAKFSLGFAPAGDALLAHLKDKGFSADTMLNTGVFFRSKHSNILVNRFAGRLMFPILDSTGKCIGFGGRILKKSTAAKYINSPESDVFLKSHHLYGYSIAKRGSTKNIIIVEGYLDVISMHQAGFDGAVAPLGTTLGEAQINMCWKVCDFPVVALDGDDAGQKASYRWIDRILPAIVPGKSFRFAQLPSGADPDSLLSSGHAAIVADAIENAIPLSDWMWKGAFLLHPSETPEQKAAMIKMLGEKIKSIGNGSIRKLYANDIRQKERDLYWKKRTKTSEIADIRPIVSLKEKIEKILLVTLINHPHIIDEVIEDFIKIDFSNREVGEIKNRLLEHHSKYAVESSEKYAESMAELEAEVLDLAQDLAIHARFIDKNSSRADALAGWHEFFERYSATPMIASDLQNAVNRLKSTFSHNDWLRLQALKNETIIKEVKK